MVELNLKNLNQDGDGHIYDGVSEFSGENMVSKSTASEAESFEDVMDKLY